MLRSLRSRLIVASVLWTAGLLMVMHMLTLMVVHILPGVRTSHISHGGCAAFMSYMKSLTAVKNSTCSMSGWLPLDDEEE